MTSEVDLRELTDEMIRAVDAHVTSYQVGLLLVGNGASCGTGVCVQLEDRYFVATAGHNLSGSATEDILIVAGPEPDSAHTPIKSRYPGPDEAAPSPDVGYIELEADVAESLGRSFLPANRFLTDHPYAEDSFTYLKGFPSDLVPKELAERGVYQLAHLGFFIKAIDPSAAEVDIDPLVQIALDYKDTTLHLTTGAQLDTPDPYGISGAGIWSFPSTIAADGIWSPEVTQLIGIETSWVEARRIVLGVQIQHWLELLASG